VLAEVQQGVLQVVVYVCIDDFVVPHDVVGLAQGGERIHFVLHLLQSDFAFENEVGRLEAYQFLLLLLHVDALVEVDSILSSDELTFHAPSPLLEVFLVPGLDLHCEAGVDGVPVHVLQAFVSLVVLAHEFVRFNHVDLEFLLVDSERVH